MLNRVSFALLPLITIFLLSCSTRIPLVHRSSNFPAIFMLILVIVVVIYFGYHNRNKIHQFIKTGYSRTKHSGSSYLKVKLEDDIDLPRDANTEYIY